LLLVLFLVVATASGCMSADHEDERRAALAAFVETLELEPLPDERIVRIGRTQSKSDAPYFSASGVLDEPSREASLRQVEAAFERDGWEVLESGPIDYFLGKCARARRGSMVAVAHVGWVTQPGFNPYPRLPGRVYVATLVGREGSNQLFTKLERPYCGAT
jgi:hypothetical protein